MLDTLPFDFSASALISGFLFSIVGLWMWRQGGRTANLRVRLTGVALMLYPMFTHGPLQDWGLGVVLCGLGSYFGFDPFLPKVPKAMSEPERAPKPKAPFEIRGLGWFFILTGAVLVLRQAVDMAFSMIQMDPGAPPSTKQGLFTLVLAFASFVTGGLLLSRGERAIFLALATGFGLLGAAAFTLLRGPRDTAHIVFLALVVGALFVSVQVAGRPPNKPEV